MSIVLKNFLSFNFIIIFFLLFLINLFILNKRYLIANFFNILDYPNERKIHFVPTPLVGGICLYLTVLISSIFVFYQNEISIEKFTVSLLLYSIFFVVGFWDDTKNISPLKKTLIVLISLIILIKFENDFLLDKLIFKSSNFVINLENLSIIFTIFCVFALFNALNFIDGCNGSAISIVIFWTVFLFFKNPNLIYLFLILSMFLIFLYNLEGKIFLGNSGTNFLSIFFSLRIVNDYNISNSIYADEIFFILLFPGIDMIRVTLERIINRKKIYFPDKTHFHHYLLKKNIKYIWQIVLILSMTPIFMFYIFNNIFFTSTIFIIIYSLFLIYLKKS